MRRFSGTISARWLVTAAIILSGVALLGMGAFRYFRPRVDITKVVRGSVVEAFYATGTVSAPHEYSIRSTTAGIVRLKVDKGSVVHKGDVLVVVENSDLRFAVDQANAELRRKQLLADDAKSPVLGELRARAQASNDMLDIALKDEKRVIGLMDHGATSQNDLDQSMNRVKAMWSDAEAFKSQLQTKKIDLDKDVEVAQAALVSAQWNLDQATIHSPVNGTVLDWPMSDGSRVAANDHILQLADVSPENLVMRAQVDEEDKNKLRPPAADGNRQVVKMTLYAYPNEVLSGTVDKIYDKADPDRRTYEVDVKFDKPDIRLSAGMTGELNFIVAERQDATIVPTQAVQGGMVMVVRDGQLERPDIVLGLRSVERTEIRSGIDENEIVVISPTLDLQPGQSVSTHWIEPLAAALVNAPKNESDSFKGFR